MRKARIVAIMCLCVLVTLLCVGCVESISVTQYVDGGGSLHRIILVSYEANAVDAEELKTEIKTVMNRYVDSHALADYATISEDKDGEVTLDLLFPSLTEYYMWLGYTGREENEGEGATKKGIVDAYDRKIDSYLTEKNVASIRALLDEEYRDLPLTATCYYTYGTTNRSTISNGERSERDGVYYHTWQLAADGSSEMMIRVYGLNVTAIYLIAISVFVLSLAIIFVIIYLKRRKEKLRAALPHDSPRLSERIAPIEHAEASEEVTSRDGDGEER